MNNVIQFVPRVNLNKDSVSYQNDAQEIIKLIPKNKTYNQIVEPELVLNETMVYLTKEQSVIFYANFIFSSMCSSPNEVIKAAKNNIGYVKQCGNSFLICHNDNFYSYITLKTPIKVSELTYPTSNCNFKENIKEGFELEFDEEQNRFFTWVDEYSEDFHSRNLFLMPSCF